MTVCAPSYRGLSDHEIEGIPVKRFRYAPAALETLTHHSGATNKLQRNPLYLALLPGYLLAGAARVRRLCRQEHWDVIHVHWPMPQGILALAGRHPDARIVSTFYGADLALARRSRLLGWLLQRVVAASSAVTAISRYTGQQLTQLTGATPTIIPYGMDMTPRHVAEVGAKPAPYELLIVGRLIERKGHLILLEALARLGRPDVALTIIGEGQDRSRIEGRIAALGLAGRVRLLGRVSDADLQRAYARCDICLLPAITDSAGDTEGLGMVLLEAMRYEKPVIASDLGGIKDIVEDDASGVLVAPGDAPALAAAIGALLDDPARRARLGRDGRRINAERFAWERIVDAYLQAYRP